MSNEKTDLKKTLSDLKNSFTGEKPAQMKGWSDKQKMAVVASTILLGGTAFIASSRVKGNVIEPKVPESKIDSVKVENQELEVGVEHTVTGGTICPTEDVKIATVVTDTMSFDEAFATARAELGLGSIFEWKGNVYNTYFREEWLALTTEEKKEFLSQVGFKHEAPKKDDDGEIIPEPLPEFREIIIDGYPSVAWDLKGDGIVDQVIIYDLENGEQCVIFDSDGDNKFDLIGLIDSSTMDIISSEYIEGSVEVLTMEDIDNGIFGEVIDSGVKLPEEVSDENDDTVDVEIQSDSIENIDIEYEEYDDEGISSYNDPDYNNEGDISDVS